MLILNERHKGLIGILTANTIFGLNIPVTKALMDRWMTPLGYTITRMFFGVVVFWLIGLFVRDIKVQKRDMVVILLGGLMGFIGTQFLFSEALEYTTPVIFSLLMALTPVVVLILSSVFLKESIPAKKIIGVIISILGAGFIILVSSTHEGSGSNTKLGILFSVLCVLCYGGYMVLTRAVSTKYQPVTIAKWMFLVSVLVALPFSFNGLQNQSIYSEHATPMAIALLLFALLFSTTLAFFLMPYALKRLEASTVSVFMNLQPLIASIVAITVGQDQLTWDKPLAALLVLTGVYLVTAKKKQLS